MARWRRGCAVSLLLAVTLSGCDGSPEPTSTPSPTDPGAATIEVHPDQPVSLELADGASVSLPAGAVDAPTELSARDASLPAPAPDNWQNTGPVVDIDLGRPLLEAAELRLREHAIEEVVDAELVFAATFDEAEQEWVVLPTEITGDGWTAVTHHFSIFGWFTDLSDWAVGTWADSQGRRAEEPSCEGRPPRWSDSVYLSERNSPLRVCVGHDPADADRLVVKIANNRGYGMLVDIPPGVAWEWQRGLSGPARSAMSDYLGTIFSGLDANTTGLRYLAPGDEIHVGIDRDLVASVGHQVVIDAPTQVSLALITAIQGMLSQLVEISGDDGWVAAIVAAQTLAACTGAGLDFLGLRDPMSAARLLQTCVVNNFSAIVNTIVSSEAAWHSFGPVQGIDRLGGAAWGKRVGQLLRRVHYVGLLNTLGFLGELLSDMALSASAKQVNVYAQVQGPPVASELVVLPEGLGPLRIGMSPEEALATRMVTWDPDYCPADLYGMDIGTWVTAPVYGTEEGRSEFYVGPSSPDGPTSIQRIDVMGSSPATTGGIRVGSTLEELLQVHGQDLREVPVPEWAVSQVFAWERDGRALVFEGGADEAGVERVWFMIVQEAAVQYYPIADTDDVAGAC